jgi:hypothetical protein
MTHTDTRMKRIAVLGNDNSWGSVEKCGDKINKPFVGHGKLQWIGNLDIFFDKQGPFNDEDRS